jgi:hypothetical protein
MAPQTFLLNLLVIDNSTIYATSFLISAFHLEVIDCELEITMPALNSDMQILEASQ